VKYVIVKAVISRKIGQFLRIKIWTHIGIINDIGAFSKFIEDFIKREENDKSLESMGYVLEEDESNNPVYKRTW
jgi:hypothetical protein